MPGKMTSLVLSLVVLTSVTNAANPNPICLWHFDGNAVDSSGHERHGTLHGDPQFVPGVYNEALELDGDDYVTIDGYQGVLGGQALSLSAWIRTSDNSGTIMAWGNPGSVGFMFWVWQNRLTLHLNQTNYVQADTPISDREWHHAVIVVAQNAVLSNGDVTIYLDGQDDTRPSTSSAIAQVEIGTDAALGASSENPSLRQLTALIDDVYLYDRALSQEEIGLVMNGEMQLVFDRATRPNPAHEQADVPRDVMLDWTPGESAVSHDVYFGTDWTDVNTATEPASQGQDASRFDPGRLEFSRTYYWRVDEVSGAPDNTLFKGDVWSFAVEPEAVPVEHVTATASVSMPGSGPENTVNGSGLNELDQHGTATSTMWTAPSPTPWIQYEFDRAYTLHEMLVWNSNQTIEQMIPFGIKEVTVAYSTDGEDWAALEGIITLNQATGSADYVANTAVDLGGVTARMIKLSVVSGYGAFGQTSLSEVRFMAIPVDARDPQPADSGTADSVDVELSWRAGRKAASHEIYLGTDLDNLTLIDTTTEPTTVTEALDYMTTYVWSVTEINEVEVPTSHAGHVWTFTTPEFAVVDDFEAYSSDEGEEVFATWLDGYAGDASLGGSTTGHIDGPFVETTVVNPGTGGRQSMPVYIDNDGGFVDIDNKTSAPTFSEVVRGLDSQDWTASGITVLSIVFAGSADLTGQLYCRIGDTKLLYDGDAAHLGATSWQRWIIDLSQVNGNLENVRELAIGVEGGTSGILYVDDIRLYTQTGQ